MTFFSSVWFKIISRVVLGTIVIGIMFNLITYEILSDSEGWLHALLHSRLLPWLLVSIMLFLFIEILPRKGKPNIKIATKEVTLRGGWWETNMPSTPLKLQIFLDVRNKGDATGYINFIEVSKGDTGTSMFTTPYIDGIDHTYIMDSDKRSIEWPLVVEPGSRVTNLMVEITVEIKENQPEKFASRFNEMKKFSVVLKYEWEGVAGPKKHGKLCIKDDYETFKQYIKEEWYIRGYKDLIQKTGTPFQ